MTGGGSGPAAAGGVQAAALALLRACFRPFPLPAREAAELWAAAAPHLPWLRQKRIDSILYLACGRETPEQSLYDAAWGRQRAALLEALAALGDAGIPVITFKGAELAALLDGRAASRAADVDVLVRRRHLAHARRVLQGLGYVQGEFSRDGRRLVEFDHLSTAELELSHYELASFVRLEPFSVPAGAEALAASWDASPVWATAEGFVLDAAIDVHHGVASDVSVEDLWERAVPSRLGAGLTLSAADHLWFTVSRYYNEVARHGKRTLRDFAFLALLLARGEVEWAVVKGAARQHGLNAALYYYLAFLDRLGGGVVPPEVLDAVRPTPERRTRDFGWQLAPLFDTLDPFPLDDAPLPPALAPA